MPALTDFLMARIKEDEERARQAQGFIGRAHAGGRMLDECLAKRQIVKFHDPFLHMECGTWHASVSEPPECPTLRALALPYANHPDFHERWRI